MNLTIRNTGESILSWTLTFTFRGDQRIGDWQSQVTAQASTTPDPLAAQMRAISGQPTAIILDL